MQTPLACFCNVPDSVRFSWAQSSGRVNDRGIILLEVVGPLVLLTTFPHMLRDCIWLHLINNSCAVASLLNGSSSIDHGDYVVGITWPFLRPSIALAILLPCRQRVKSCRQAFARRIGWPLGKGSSSHIPFKKLETLAKPCRVQVERRRCISMPAAWVGSVLK